jgi:hypothetical protein
MRELDHLDGAEIVDWGHATTLKLAFSDGSKETVKIPANLLGPLVLAINSSAELAERTRQAQPGQAISVEVPLDAIRVDTGTMEDGTIGLRIWIKNGPSSVLPISRPCAGCHWVLVFRVEKA